MPRNSTPRSTKRRRLSGSENYNTALSNYKAQYYENLRKYFERFPTGSGIWSADQGISWMNTFFNGSNKRGDYYEVMKESMALMLKYEKFDTSPYTADSVKALKKAYNSLVSTANQTGSGKTAQQNKIDALKKAFDGETHRRRYRQAQVRTAGSADRLKRGRQL